jgi:hypothetical protein
VIPSMPIALPVQKLFRKLGRVQARMSKAVPSRSIPGEGLNPFPLPPPPNLSHKAGASCDSISVASKIEFPTGTASRYNAANTRPSMPVKVSRFTSQHVELMTKCQDPCLQRRSRPEQSDQLQPNQAANISDQPRASPISTSLASRIEFPTVTGLLSKAGRLNNVAIALRLTERFARLAAAPFSLRLTLGHLISTKGLFISTKGLSKRGD